MAAFDLTSWLLGLGALLALMTVVWAIHRPLKDASIIDPVWPAAFLLAQGVYLASAPGPITDRGWLSLILVALWTLRLGGYLVWRKLEEPGEDRRYQAMRAKRGDRFPLVSLWIVFWLQAGLAWFVSLPLLANARGAADLGVLDALGAALFVLGFLFEAFGDRQLARFKADPANRGQVLDRGLWRYTRHPNYFGNACIWWGLGLLALSTGAWWSLAGPLFMTFLLLKVSGVALLESDMADRRPAYREYVRRTSAFVPWPPRPR